MTYRKDEFHLAQEIDQFQSKLEKRGFHNIDRVLILRSMLSVLDPDIYARDWHDLIVREEIRPIVSESLQKAGSGINLAIDFLNDWALHQIGYYRMVCNSYY